jgi:hypothetical protein
VNVAEGTTVQIASRDGVLAGAARGALLRRTPYRSGVAGVIGRRAERTQRWTHPRR